jgi:hypothetical protein
MPRFMVMIKGNSQSEAGIQPNARLAEQMDAYNEELVRAASGSPRRVSSQARKAPGSLSVAARPRSSTAHSPRPRKSLVASGSCSAARSRSASNGSSACPSMHYPEPPATARSTFSRSSARRDPRHRRPNDGWSYVVSG